MPDVTDVVEGERLSARIAVFFGIPLSRLMVFQRLGDASDLHQGKPPIEMVDRPAPQVVRIVRGQRGRYRREARGELPAPEENHTALTRDQADEPSPERLRGGLGLCRSSVQRCGRSGAVHRALIGRQRESELGSNHQPRTLFDLAIGSRICNGKVGDENTKCG